MMNVGFTQVHDLLHMNSPCYLPLGGVIVGFLKTICPLKIKLNMITCRKIYIAYFLNNIVSVDYHVQLYILLAIDVKIEYG